MEKVLYSRKFWASLVSFLVVITNGYGLQLDQEQLLGVVLSVAAYVLGQGIADFGKEAK